jgi:hypothetical protein
MRYSIPVHTKGIRSVFNTRQDLLTRINGAVLEVKWRWASLAWVNYCRDRAGVFSGMVGMCLPVSKRSKQHFQESYTCKIWRY